MTGDEGETPEDKTKLVGDTAADLVVRGAESRRPLIGVIGNVALSDPSGTVLLRPRARKESVARAENPATAFVTRLVMVNGFGMSFPEPARIFLCFVNAENVEKSLCCSSKVTGRVRVADNL